MGGGVSVFCEHLLHSCQQMSKYHNNFSCHISANATDLTLRSKTSRSLSWFVTVALRKTGTINDIYSGTAKVMM